jgi:ribosomal protein L34E
MSSRLFIVEAHPELLSAGNVAITPSGRKLRRWKKSPFCPRCHKTGEHCRCWPAIRNPQLNVLTFTRP